MPAVDPVVSGANRGPLVTIAIPTFNRGSLLTACIHAALAQTYPNFEVVVSDNASTDETPEVLRQIHDPRLRVIRQPTNIGLMRNWNACLDEAKGDYIVFVSDDDHVEPWLLDRCMALVAVEPVKVVIALCDAFFTMHNRVEPVIVSRKFTTGIWDGADLLQQYLRKELSAHMCTILIQTKAFRDAGGFSLDFPHVGDLAAWGPLLMTGKGGLVNERCGTYLVHESSESFRFGVDALHNDFKNVIALITNTSDRYIANSRKRQELKFEVTRHFLARAVMAIAAYRRKGAELAQVMPLIWNWRWELISLHRPRILYTLFKSLVAPTRVRG